MTVVPNAVPLTSTLGNQRKQSSYLRKVCHTFLKYIWDMKDYEKSKQVLSSLNFYLVILLFAVGVTCIFKGIDPPRWIDAGMYSSFIAFLIVRLIIMILESGYGTDK